MITSHIFILQGIVIAIAIVFLLPSKITLGVEVQPHEMWPMTRLQHHLPV
jgi:hypothetical protein